ncbi:MAG: glycosyltransferase, partial [Saprospiraceae bacterium]|nr:glycosyltransferase [Saprospiraceae bacterium]
SREERIKLLEKHVENLEFAKQEKQRKIDELTEIIAEKEAETVAVKASMTYRVGRYATWPFRTTWSGMQRLFFGRRLRKQEEREKYDLIARSEYFDQEYYLKHNPDVLEQDLDPVWHFLLFGEAEGRNPSKQFDVNFYRKAYPDVALGDMNALLHFLKYGKREGRIPHPARKKNQTGKMYELISPSDELILDVEHRDRYEIWRENNAINKDLRRTLKAYQAELRYRPLISIVMPVYNVRKKWLRKAVESVQEQIYSNWELCIADDASPARHIRPLLKELAREDGIKVTTLDSNQGISGATNAALGLADGEFIVFMDNDDELAPDALLEIAIALNEDRGIDVVYSDEDKIDQRGRHYGPFFKPDWSPELLLSYNYFNKLLCVKTDLVREVGGLRSEFDGAQDYDLILRVTDRANKVHHIPRVLYHWRALPSSIAGDGDAKSGSHDFFDKCRAALQDFLDQKEIPARAFHPDFAKQHHLGLLHLTWPDEGPLVSIIIPSKDHHEVLNICLQSLNKTTYHNYEVIVADNASQDPATLDYLEEIQHDDHVRVVVIPNKSNGFSYAAINNEAVKYANGKLLCFLNDDTEIIKPQWLSQMVGYASLEGVGICGAKLLFPDGTIQHAGAINGMYQREHNMLPEHAWRNLEAGELGYGYFVNVARNYTAVTAACMVVDKALFETCGGFDEELFPISYNDVDLCLKVWERGQRIAYVQEAEVTHFESKSRNKIVPYQDVVNFKKKYRTLRDPYYNPNLSRYRQYEIWPANSRQYRDLRQDLPKVMAVTHNLNLEGAPLVLFEVCAGLVDRGLCRVEVYAPEDGPLRSYYEEYGMTVHVFGSPLDEQHRFPEALQEMGDWFASRGTDLVLANTLNTFYAHEAGLLAGIPTVWSIHESVDVAEYFNVYAPEIRTHALNSFAHVYAVIFAAKATRNLYEKVNVNDHFPVINYGLKRDKIDAYCADHTREDARQELGVDDDRIV